MCPLFVSVRTNYNVIKFMIMLEYSICYYCLIEIEIIRIHIMNPFFRICASAVISTAIQVFAHGMLHNGTAYCC